MSERRIPELDGIRGVAIALVIFWHYLAVPGVLAPPDTLGGILYQVGQLTWSGVDLFFVLSGFLIGGILIDAKASPTYFKTFYLRRSFRILPLYLALCVVGAAIVGSQTGLTGVFGRPMPIYIYATFVQDFWLANHSWDVYLNVTWSLAVEEQFYLVLPFIIRFVRGRHLPLVVGALALASIGVRSALYLYSRGAWAVAAYTLVFCRADALMIGVLGALVVRKESLVSLLSRKRWMLPVTVAVFGGAVAVLQFKGWTMETRPMSTVGYTVLALFYLSLLLLAVMHTAGWWAAVMRFGPLRRLGGLAYCVYLLHEPTLRASRYLLYGRTPPAGVGWKAAALGLALTLGLAQLSWRYFESKMIRIGHRFSYAGA